MKFNPLTNTLYTDDNKRIKKMHCPYPSLQWDALTSLEESQDKFCDNCEHTVVETKVFTDDALWELLQNEPNTCLKVDFNQDNIRIVHNV